MSSQSTILKSFPKEFAPRPLQEKLIGEIQEKIIEKDQVNKSLTYAVIKSPAPLSHHLAKVTVYEDSNFSKLVWISEVEPDEFEKLIAYGMESSIEMIKKILE